MRPPGVNFNISKKTQDFFNESIENEKKSVPGSSNDNLEREEKSLKSKKEKIILPESKKKHQTKHIGEDKTKAKSEYEIDSNSQKGNLKMHIDSKHEGKKPYKCSLCDFDFNSIFEVMSHVKEIHFDVSPIFDQDNQNNNTLNSESEISEVPATPLENRTLSEESRSDHVNPKNSDPKMSENQRCTFLWSSTCSSKKNVV